MKLNWFTPLPPAKTDIGYATARVLPALAKRADVTVWITQSKWDRDLEKIVEVRRYQLAKLPWAELNRGDMTLYNIGNNPLFHETIWEVSQRHPGVVVLHDYNLQQFFFSIYLDAWQDLNAYLTQMESYYGDEGQSAAAAACRRKTPHSLIESYPLTPLAIENALGVLVHTNDALTSLRQAATCPVVYASLPFAPLTVAKPRDRLPGPPHRLIVFGFLGPNRRLDQLLKVLGELAGQHQFQLDIYGEVSNKSQLRKIVNQLGLNKQVKFHGFVEESKLEHALSAAHLAINLRYPTAGEASGAQLRIWSHALPSLVTRADWYATLPENTVRFVRPEHELADLREHLQKFFSNPNSFSVLGQNGLALYKKQHLPEQYVEKLLNLVSNAIEFRAASEWQKLLVRARLEAANSFAMDRSNADWSELIEWGQLKQTPQVDEAWRQKTNRKVSLVYGHTPTGSGRPPLIKRLKRFVRLRLPRRVYEAYVEMRDGGGSM